MNALYRFSCLAAILLLPFSLTDLGAQESDNFQEDYLAPLPSLAPSTASLDQATWVDSRRGELLELFQDHVYGRVPTLDVSMHSRLVFQDRQALGGLAVMKEVQLDLLHGIDTVKVQVLVFLPADARGPVPLFLGLNFYGNHSILPDPSISLPESPLRLNESLGITSVRAKDDSRGLRASRWPVEAILSRGYGLATVYCGDLDPDEDDGFHNGVHRLDPSERDSSSWGTIAAWAWGLSRVLDYFEQDVEVDASRVAVIGHSRLGKTALWAGAMDQRFAMVISNNSGCGGAALSRRNVGESVERINASFPHWFAERFNDYSGNEAACPVDQHQLLALMAPRPLYVASATEDQWADPVGEYLSLYHGSKVYPLFGLDSLVFPHPPKAGEPRWAGRVAYHLRSGKHDLTAWDWKHYLDFADLHLQAEDEAQSENPVSTEWLDTHLRHGHPRLVLSPELDLTGLAFTFPVEFRIN